MRADAGASGASGENEAAVRLMERGGPGDVGMMETRGQGVVRLIEKTDRLRKKDD